MRRARVNTATVGVFSWALLEPEEGKFEFGWLDDALDRLHAGGVRVVLATPTAAPPPWFTLAYPEAMPVRPDGTRLWHQRGARQLTQLTGCLWTERLRSEGAEVLAAYSAGPLKACPRSPATRPVRAPPGTCPPCSPRTT